MYVRPRPRFRPRNAGGVAFSPALLFTSGVQGAWYDPSDINNYTAQSGPELIVNGNFSNGTTGWSATNATLSAASNQLTITSTSNFGIGASTGFTTVVGRWYKASATLISCSAATARIRKTDSATNFNVGIAHLVNGIGWYSGQVFTVYFQATATTTYIMGVTDLNPSNITIANVSVVETISVANATLFEDSAGTTPVTAVEQPVGLMLDKSQGLVLGSELVTNGDFSGGTTGWTNSSTGTGTFSVSGGLASIAGADASNRGVVGQGFTTVVGKTYVLTFTASAVSGATLFGPSTASGYSFSLASAAITAGTTRFQFVATTTTTYVNFAAALSTSGAASLDNISVKELPGNHARQATPTSCPVLRARYNLLTYSEQFDNAVWTKNTGGVASAPTVTANAGLSPIGDMTADRMQFLLNGGTTTTDISDTRQVATVIAATHTFSFWIRSYDGTSTYQMLVRDANGFVNQLAVTGSWQRVTLTATYGAGSASLGFGIRGGQTPTNSNAADVLVWGADLRTGSSAGTYQRIAAATDYATAGFLPYLYFVTDDSFGTNSIDFTATDKMSVCAGVTKLSDAVQVIAELSANSDSTAGTFYLANVATSTLRHQVAGSPGGATRALGDTTLTNPSTAVVTQQFNIAGASVATQIVVRQNGVAQTLASTAGTAGTGNFSSNPLFIGRRNNSSFPFNGNFYQLIVCGKTLSASELASTEAYVATKTGVTL